MNNHEIDMVLRSEFLGELKGLNQVLQIMNKCIVYSKGDNKNYVDGDLFVKLINERKDLLLDRQTRHSHEIGKY